MMGENTKIEWAHHTFNPWYGCQKIGPGCDHCYAEGWAKRSGLVQWGPDAERRRGSPSNWKKPLAWNAEAERLGIRYRVFCASLADVFDNAVPAEWRRDLFDLIELTPQLDWLLVTKRIGNVFRMVADARAHDWLAGRKNVWLGITVVNQEEADRDIPKLLQVPACVRFLSMEPLLGPVDLIEAIGMREPVSRYNGWHDLHWVIVGGESGHSARPMAPTWVRSLRDQCEAAGVPFLFKQWGEFAPNNRTMTEVAKSNRKLVPVPAGDATFPADLVDRVGKKIAGRLLDGVQHDGYPKARYA